MCNKTLTVREIKTHELLQHAANLFAHTQFSKRDQLAKDFFLSFIAKGCSIDSALDRAFETADLFLERSKKC